MRTLKKSFALVCMLLLGLAVNAQDSDSEVVVTLEFENAKTASALLQDYTRALQKGDVETMNAQLHEKAMIYGIGGGLDSLNIEQHKAYFTQSTNQFKHSIERDVYLPVKVENNWNEGDWILSWGTNTITDKKTGKEIVIPYHTAALVNDNKIVMMRYYYDNLNIARGQGFTLTPPTSKE